VCGDFKGDRSIEKLMKFYISCRECGIKLYFSSEAKLRNELPTSLKFTCFNGHTFYYSSQEVWAEVGFSAFTSGALIGGVIGAVAGGSAGATIGAFLFGAAGANQDEREREAVKRFNNSW